MSIQRASISNTGTKQDAELTVVEFFGGKDNGLMIQLTQGLGLGPDDPKFVQLDAKTSLAVARLLLEFVVEQATKKSDEIGELIREYAEAKNTIFGEAKQVAHYLTDLDVAKIPAMILLGHCEVTIEKGGLD